MNEIIKDVVRVCFPGCYVLYQDLRRPTPKAIFTGIYETRGFGSWESVSGQGSTLAETAVVRTEIPKLIARFDVKKLLDIPCGDHNWMRHVALPECRYIGADVVEALVREDTLRFGTPNKEFLPLDVTKNKLPRADLVLCRDCLVHLSFRAIRKALRQIRASGAAYLLTTTFPDREGNNDIRTGEWRVLNLQVEPFNFPEPIILINERCPSDGGAYRDKSLGLWRVCDIPECKPKRQRWLLPARQDFPGRLSIPLEAKASHKDSHSAWRGAVEKGT